MGLRDEDNKTSYDPLAIQFELGRHRLRRGVEASTIFRTTDSYAPITTSMNWLVASSVCSIVFAAAAVPVRRRFGTGALLAAAAIAAGAVFALGLIAISRRPPPDGEGFGDFVLGTAVLGGAAGGVAALERILRASTLPDPLVELVVTAAAAIGGALLGAGAGAILASMSGARIA